MEYIGPILTAVALVIGSVGLYLKRKNDNDEKEKSGWEGYSKRLEAEIVILKAENKELSGKNIVLEKKVLRYEVMSGKVEEAKAVLHETVETKLEEIKQP